MKKIVYVVMLTVLILSSCGSTYVSNPVSNRDNQPDITLATTKVNIELIADYSDDVSSFRIWRFYDLDTNQVCYISENKFHDTAIAISCY